MVGSIDHTVDAHSTPGLAGGPDRHSVDRALDVLAAGLLPRRRRGHPRVRAGGLPRGRRDGHRPDTPRTPSRSSSDPDLAGRRLVERRPCPGQTKAAHGEPSPVRGILPGRPCCLRLGCLVAATFCPGLGPAAPPAASACRASRRRSCAGAAEPAYRARFNVDHGRLHRRRTARRRLSDGSATTTASSRASAARSSSRTARTGSSRMTDSASTTGSGPPGPTPAATCRRR